jgi:Predicted hydrolase of the alpha/beta superfamily
MFRERAHFTRSRDGTRIECVITDDTTLAPSTAPRDWFVLVHAHPKLGGNRQMMQPLARALARRGFGSVCVALRGTSGSLGSSSWRGTREEGEDVCAAADLVVDGTCAGGDARARVHLIGYSYGSTVCAYALGQRSCIASYVAIGYPRGSYGCGLFGVGAKWLMRDHASRLMEDETTPKLFVHPSRDEFTTVQTMERFVGEKLSKGVKELRVLEGAGHFAFVQDEAAADAAVAWIEEFVESLKSGEERVIAQ